MLWIANPTLADNPIIAEGYSTGKEKVTMAEVKDRKKEMIEKSARRFQRLNEDNKMFILGYMMGIEQERQRKTSRAQRA